MTSQKHAERTKALMNGVGKLDPKTKSLLRFFNARTETMRELWHTIWNNWTRNNVHDYTKYQRRQRWNTDKRYSLTLYWKNEMWIPTLNDSGDLSTPDVTLKGGGRSRDIGTVVRILSLFLVNGRVYSGTVSHWNDEVWFSHWMIVELVTLDRTFKREDQGISRP